jgi:DNA-directed RNA polymerase specialized sigma24 family protein
MNSGMEEEGLEGFMTVLHSGDLDRAVREIPEWFSRSAIARIQSGLRVGRSEAMSLYHRALLELQKRNGDFKYRDPDSLRKYLFLTARSLRDVERTKSQRYLETVQSLATKASEDLEIEIDPPSDFNWELITQCLTRIPCKCQLLIVLKKYASWSHDQIVADLGNAYAIGTPDSCRNQLKVCKRRLRQLIVDSMSDATRD